MTGSDALAVRASKKLRNDESLVTTLGATILRKHLDDVPLWRGDHVPIRQLVDDFARYLYLPRLAGPEALVNAIRGGLALLTWQTDTFALAESFEEEAHRYRGLRGGQQVVVTQDSADLLVKPEVARRQLELETPTKPGGGEGTSGKGEGGREGTGGGKPGKIDAPTEMPRPRRFHGSVALNPIRVGGDAGRVAEEVIMHLTALPDAAVKVTLEIEADIPGGAPDNVVRTVTENSRTLKFSVQGFESE